MKKKIVDLIPYANNSRTHSDEQINKIAASIKEFGFLNPVIIDSDGGIIAGHGRVMAAKKLGIEEAPVVDASHLTEAQKKAYIIADNRLALDAGWDEEILMHELEDIASFQFDIDVIGFTDKELSKLFDESKGITIEDNLENDLVCSIKIEFDPEKRIEVINAVTSVIEVIPGTKVFCGDNNE